MLIIQKMVLTLLAIALLPIFLVAALFYYNTWTYLQSRELDLVGAIASVQKGRVETILSQNQSRLTSYTSRAGLRTTLDQYNHQTGKEAAATQAVLQTSVTSLLAGDPALRSVTLLDPNGRVVASTDIGSIGKPYLRANYVKVGRTRNDSTSYIVKNAQGELSLYMVGPLPQGSSLAGMAVLETDLRSLEKVATDDSGLGRTGEVMLVKRTTNGDALDLLPLRFDPRASLGRVVKRSDIMNPATRALWKSEGQMSGLTDYRGQKVLSATRYLPEADWGLVVTKDQSEAYAPLQQLSDLLVIVMFILSVVIIFVAFYLARYLNEPILTLAATADKIRGGDLTQRAPVLSGDEIGRLASNFNAMVDNVEKVDQMKSEFVLLASHQLRTPATAVKGFISMLLDGYKGKVAPAHLQLLKAAYEENERQISVINSILDVARMDAGEMVLERTMSDMRKVAEASAAAQIQPAKQRRQTITVKAPQRPVMNWVDAEKLQLVVDNLIHNATKYSGEGTAITVEVKRSGDQASITVSDHGIGIAKEDMSRLFKRFSRISGPETANIQGAGLGLYLADRLVKLHGGRISVTSVVGKGTSFSIVLPITTKEDRTNGSSSDS